MTGDRLPGIKRSYVMRAGEGERSTFGGQLATTIASDKDTGGLLEVIILSGGKGASFPLHRHRKAHESFFVLDGQLELSIDGKKSLLSRGDYANIPPGLPHGYWMRGHRTQILSWAVESNLARMYSLIGEPYAGRVHPSEVPSDIAAELLEKAQAGSDVEFLGAAASFDTPRLMPVAIAPKGVEAYVIESGEGERMIAAQQLLHQL